MGKNVFLAEKEDGKQISKILESVVGSSLFTMAYTRRPDAYESYMKESGKARVYVQKEGDKIAQTCAVLIRDMYVKGKPTKTGYICGLKKNPEYNGTSVSGLKFFRCFKEEDADLFYCCVVIIPISLGIFINKNYLKRLLKAVRFRGFTL